jgi:hypothetical protein
MARLPRVTGCQAIYKRLASWSHSGEVSFNSGSNGINLKPGMSNVLPHLEYLGIQCPNGFSKSECLDNSPLLRLVGWTRAHLTPPLRHLKVWEGRGTTDNIAVDYASPSCLVKHLGMFLPNSAVLFRQLQHLQLFGNCNTEIPILPYLEQIEKLEIWRGIIPEYSLNIDLPLTHTLKWLILRLSTSSWMLGRTFKALREFKVTTPLDKPENQSMCEGLQMDLPACTTLQFDRCPMDYLRFLSCSNVQILRWGQIPTWTAFEFPFLNSLRDFVMILSHLRNLDIFLYPHPALDSLIQFVFCDAHELGVWRDIRSVEATVTFSNSSDYHSFTQMIEHQQLYEKWWKVFTVTKYDLRNLVMVKASM